MIEPEAILLVRLSENVLRDNLSPCMIYFKKIPITKYAIHNDMGTSFLTIIRRNYDIAIITLMIL
jgi:hypothetical protein